MLHLNELKNFLHAARHNTAIWVVAVVLESLHGVGLTSASLTISQDGRVVPLKYRLDRWARRVGIDSFLATVLVIDVIEAVALPNAQMWVLFNVSCALTFINFLAKVFHDSD